MFDLTKKYLNSDVNNLIFEDIKILQKIISYHSDLYYNKQSPIISDSEYDDLFRKLTILEEKFDVNIKQSIKVGSNVIKSSFKKIKHSRPMISLDNTYNEEDLNDFDERVKKLLDIDNLIEYTLEFKFDGLGVELIYKNGKLIQAITRGNGVEGEDVTQNVLQIDNIPKEINYKEHLEVRGEVVMPISVFEKLNNEAKKIGDKIFSNPRNAASGSLRLLDNSVTKERKLKFFAYDLANFTSPPAPLLRGEGSSSYYSIIKNLEKFGFEISSYFKKLNGINEVINAIDNFGDLKKTIDFEIDGLVLKVNNISLWKIVGSTEHHPRYAIAYKFPAEIMTTRVLSVEHSVGRTGTITPVANLEPINIGGVIVKRATLHNYEEIENLDLRIGDSVFIKRAGEVIPKIISVIKEARNDDNISKNIITPPEFCPSCGSKVLKDDDKVRYYCSNKVSCPIQNSEKLAWSVGKQGFNIDGLGEKQVELFLGTGIINDLSDIFDIENKTREILELEGFQEKSVTNLIESINKAKNLDIARFLTALGISGVGKKTAKTLSKLFLSKENLINFNYELEDLEKLDDVGPEIAKNIIEYFGDEKNKKLISKLLEKLNIEFYKKIDKIDKIGFFSGKKMCITGSFEGYSRDELIKLLEDNGGEFVSAVSKNTDYLLAGEKVGSKLKKAQELGIEILNLTNFLKRLLD